MNNIQKLADDIFKAPTSDELFERIVEYGTFEETSDLGEEDVNLSKEETDALKQTFPHGALYVHNNASRSHELYDFIKEHKKNFRVLVSNKKLGNDWYVMKVLDRTVVVAYQDYRVSPYGYYIEPKNEKHT